MMIYLTISTGTHMATIHARHIRMLRTKETVTTSMYVGIMVTLVGPNSHALADSWNFAY